MRNMRVTTALVATLSLGTATGVSAAATTGAVHYGARISGSGRAHTGSPLAVSLHLTLPHGDRIARYTLDFGDHTRPKTGSKLPGTARHTYLRAGSYVVRLVVVDRGHVVRRASLAERVSGRTFAKRPTALDPGLTPSGLPSPPAGCDGTSSPGVNAYDTTPTGAGPWTVPTDPCNSEGVGNGDDAKYSDSGYWAAEKRPDVWVNAVLPYGYAEDPFGPWNVEVDAARAGYPIDSNPRPGDLAVWNDDAVMGMDSTGTEQDASPGGQAAYVEAVNPDDTIVISEMGAGSQDGGYTYTLTYDSGTAFIHQR